MFPDGRELLWALAGNSVVGFGAGTATLAAFAPSLPLLGEPHFTVRVAVVSVGFAFFFAGYHITQSGTYRSPDRSLLASLAPAPIAPSEAEGPNRTPDDSRATGSLDPVVVARALFILLGVVGLGAGMRLFALTINSWNPTLGVVTGVVCIGGYIAGHIGLNWTLI